MPGWNDFDSFLADVNAASETDRPALVDALLAERPHWPWIEGRRATFIYAGAEAERAALSLDTIEGDPPFAPMTQIAGTHLWYVQRRFEPDDLLDYVLAINDPMTPLKGERDMLNRVTRHWRPDPHNPVRLETAQVTVSVLRMPGARPVPDWTTMRAGPRGRVAETTISSRLMGFSDRRLAIYTPPGYDPAAEYPLLILQDLIWDLGPLQVPAIADALIKHGRMEPILIAMMQGSPQEERPREFISNDRHYSFLLTELLPRIQMAHTVDPTRVGLGGVALGAIASAHAALRNPVVFSALMMISPPLGRGTNQDKLMAYARRFEAAEDLPTRIFQSVGRYEIRNRFVAPAHELRTILQRRRSVDYRFVETGSGHGLVGFRAVLPEAMAHCFPGPATQP